MSSHDPDASSFRPSAPATSAVAHAQDSQSQTSFTTMSAPRARTPMIARGLLVVVLFVMAGLAWWETPQRWALEFLDETLGQAFSAFAIAKGLNATISVLQSSTIDLQVFQVSPGEALDPANDMIERFSWVMFAATGSLALQKLLLGISGSLIIKAVASITCGLAGLMVLMGLMRGADDGRGMGNDEGLSPMTSLLTAGLLRLALLGIVLRFAVLSVALASGAAGQAFLDDSRDTQMAQLSITQQQLAEAADQQVGGDHEERSWWQQFKGSMEGWAGGPISTVTQGFDAMTDKVIDLTMLFITQTVLFPLGFLWLGLRVVHGLGRLQGVPRGVRRLGDV